MSDDYIRLIADAPDVLRARGLALSPLAERAAMVVAVLHGGIHNYSKVKQVTWGDPYCVEVPLCRDLATHDPDTLLLLIAVSSAMGLRVEVIARRSTVVAQFHLMRDLRAARVLSGDETLAQLNQRLSHYTALAKAVVDVKKVSV